MPVGQDIRVAAERGLGAFDALAGLRQTLLGRLEVMTHLIVLGLRGIAAGQQSLLAVEFPALEVEVLFRRALFGHRVKIGGAHLLDVEACRGDRGFRLLEGEAGGFGVDAEQQVALVDGVVLAHGDLDDAAGDVGGEHRLVLLEIGVVGRDIAPAGHPEIPAGQHKGERHDQHEDEAAELRR